MARIGERGYVFHAPFWRVLERGRGQEVRQPAEYDGKIIAPVSGTYTLFTPAGVVVVTAPFTVGSDGVATYTIDASALPATLDYGVGYYEEWAMLMQDGSTRSPRRIVVLARKALDPPVGDSALEDEYSDVLSSMKGSSIGSFQKPREQAWGEILRRLQQEGAWSWLVFDGSAFYSVHLSLSSAKLFRAFHIRTGDERWLREARDQETAYHRHWKSLAVAWDREQDGKPDNAEDLSGVSGGINRNAAPRSGPCLSPRF